MSKKQTRRAATQGAAATPPPRTKARLNWRFGLILGGVVVVIGLGVAATSYFQGVRLRESALASTDALIEQGRRDSAIQNLYRFLEQNPNDVEALRRLAKLRSEQIRSGPELQEAVDLNERLLRQLPTASPEAIEVRRKVARLNLDLTEAVLNDPTGSLVPFDMVARGVKTPAAKVMLDGLKTLETEPSAETERLWGRYYQLILNKDDRDPENPTIQQAIAHFRKSLEIDPKDFATTTLLAGFYAQRLGQIDDALAVVDQAMANDPDSPDPRLLRSWVLRVAGREEDARRELEAVAKMAPDNIDVRVGLIEDSLRRGDTDSARTQFLGLPDAVREEALGRRYEAIIEIYEGHPDQAMALLRSGLLASGGTDLGSAIDLLNLYQQSGRIAEARPLLDQIRRISPDSKDPNLEFYTAKQLLLSGLPDLAQPRLEALRRNEKVAKDARFQNQLMQTLGQVYLARGAFDAAKSTFREALEADPGSTTMREMLAQVILQTEMGQDAATREAAINKALALLQDGVALAPNSLGIRLNIAKLLFTRQVGRPADRRDWIEFQKALTDLEGRAPNNAAVAQLRAQFLSSQGDKEATLAALEELARRAPRNMQPWLIWAEYLARLGQPERALAVIDEATGPDAAGDRVELRVARAKILTLLQRAREAREALTEGLDHLPQSQQAEAWRSLGELAASRGEIREAREAYEQWSRLDSENFRPIYLLMDLALLARAPADYDKLLDRLAALPTGGDGVNAKPLGKEHHLYKLAEVTKLVRLPVAGTSKADRQAQLNQALGKLDTILQAAPQLEIAHLLKGEALYELDPTPENVQAAIASYGKALALGSSVALQRLVDLHVSNNDFAAIDTLPASLGRYERDRLAAESCVRRGKTDRAFGFVNKVIAAHPNTPEIQGWSSAVLSAIGPNEAVEREVQQIAAEHPERLDSWVNLVRIRSAREDKAGVEEAIKQAQAQVKDEKPELVEAALRRLTGDVVGLDHAVKAALRRYPNESDVALLAAWVFQETSQIPLAVTTIREILKREPDSQKARRMLAIILATRSTKAAEQEEAWELLGPEPKGKKVESEDAIARGIILARSNDKARREQGIARLDQFLGDIPPEHQFAMVAREELIHALIRAGNAARACQVAEMAVQTSPTPNSLMLQAEALIADGRKAQAKEPLDRFFAMLPGDPREASVRLRALWNPEDPAASAAEIESVFRARAEAKPAQAEAFGRAAYALLEPAGPKTAEPASRIVQRLILTNPALSWIQAKALIADGKVAEALDRCDASIAYGSQAEALPAASFAIRLAFDRNDPTIRTRVASLVKSAIARFPGDEDMLMNSAMVLHLDGQFQEEVKIYAKILEKYPDSAMVLNNIAWATCEGLKDYDKALGYADHALKADPENRSLLDTRGVILTRKQEYDRAIADLELSLKPISETEADKPGSPTHWFHLARAYFKKGDKAQAKRCFNEALAQKLDADKVEPFEKADFEELRKGL